MPDPLHGSFRSLEDDLVDLGRALAPAPPPADLAEAVLARVAPGDAAVAPARRRPGPDARPGVRRLGWAVAAAVVLGVGLVPPVRAAVVELLRIGGVTVWQHRAPEPSVAPSSSTRSGPAPTRPAGAVGLAEAEAALGFPITVPGALGPPASVALLEDRHVAQLTWPGPHGDTRLDVFSGSPDYGYLKQVWTRLTPVRVADREAIWIDAPHLLQWVDRTGRRQPDPVRVAGPTLIWVEPGAAGTVTYRLEGPTTLAAAMAIAESGP